MNTYTTKQGDTWDDIAFKVFPDRGREAITSLLIQNNPQYIDIVIFPAGCILSLPDIQVKRSKNLPPWLS